MTQTQDDFEQLVDTLTAKLHQMTVREAALCERNYTLVRRIGDLENENNALKALVAGDKPAPYPCPLCNGAGEYIAYDGRLISPCNACGGSGSVDLDGDNGSEGDTR